MNWTIDVESSEHDQITDRRGRPCDYDPNSFPRSGTALAVRLLADRVNWLSVVDTLIPWDRARARTKAWGRIL